MSYNTIDFKGIEAVLRRKQRIASETGFPLELAVCAVSHLLSPAVAEKQPSKRNICTVRNEEYIKVQDATTYPYQKSRLTGLRRGKSASSKVTRFKQWNIASVLPLSFSISMYNTQFNSPIELVFST